MATWNLANTGILSISYSAPVRVRNRHKDVSPATSSRLLLRTPKDRPKVCLKKTELRDPGGGDMHPMGKGTPPGWQGKAESERCVLESHRLSWILASSLIMRVLSSHLSKPQFPHLQSGGINGNTCLLGKDVTHGIKALTRGLAVSVRVREAEIAGVVALGLFSVHVRPVCLSAAPLPLRRGTESSVLRMSIG